MVINAKNFKNWQEDDLQYILENDSYRECEFIDYKENFAILECKDKIAKKKKQDEFRHDICSFANANGGFLMIGVREEAGVPVEIMGISIENVDRFELDRRNELSGIIPVIPIVEFSFILLKNGKYVVIIYISKGNCKPYVYVENEGIYKYFTRRGNGKQTMNYTEIRDNYLNVNILQESIARFREKQLEFHLLEKNMPIAIIQLVPDTFMNVGECLRLYDMYKEDKLNLRNIFSGVCYGYAVPNVDGVFFPSYDYDYHVWLQLFNNGCTEIVYDIDVRERQGEKWIGCRAIVEKMEQIVLGTQKMYQRINKRATIYVCISIIGCKGLWSSIDWESDYKACVDRNKIMCSPIKIDNILDAQDVECIIAECEKMIKYSLGIRN